MSIGTSEVITLHQIILNLYVIQISDLELRKENDNTPCKDDNRDYIKIFDGWVSWSNVLLKICSMKDITGTIKSTNNKLILMFFSDGSETFRGFNATYEPCKDSTGKKVCIKGKEIRKYLFRCKMVGWV